jgi:hypothetical protein
LPELGKLLIAPAVARMYVAPEAEVTLEQRGG